MNLGVNGQNIVNHLDRALWAERRLQPVLFVFVLTVASDFYQTTQITFRDNRRITYAAGADGMVQREDVLSRWEITVRRVRGWLRRFWLVRIGHQLFVQVRNWTLVGADETALDACPASLGPDSPQVLAGYRLTEAIVAELAQTVGDRLQVLQIPDVAQGDGRGRLRLATAREVACRGREALQHRYAVVVAGLPRGTSAEIFYRRPPEPQRPRHRRRRFVRTRPGCHGHQGRQGRAA